MAENWIQGMNRCTGPVPCTVCGVSPYKHGSYPTCASHPYTADGKCQHVGALVGSVFTGAPCAGAECKNGCVRAARGVNAPVEPDKRKPWEKSSWTCALATVNNTGMHCPPPGQRCPDCPTGVPPTRRFTGVGHLEETGYIPAGSAAEREGKDGVPPTRRFTGDGAERRVEAKAAGLRWCRHCGEGVTDFCRGKTDACPKGLPATGVNAPDRAALIAAADKHADNYEGHDIPANETRAAIRNAFVAGSQFAAGVPAIDDRWSLSVLASFAHEVLMGAIEPEDVCANARLALERTGLLRLDDVVALGVGGTHVADPQRQRELAQERACKLTECQGKPRCGPCKVMDRSYGVTGTSVKASDGTQP
jgi:hypothetical protein